MTGAPAAAVADALAQVRASCTALPEVVERPSHGAPSFFVSGKKCFVMFLDHHHDDGRLGVRLDRDPDWDEVGSIRVDAYRCIAPKKLIALLVPT